MQDDFFGDATNQTIEKNEPLVELGQEKFSAPIPKSTDLSRSFVFEETEDTTTKEVFTIYGGKGDGKTSAAFAFPGNIACLSYDRKSLQPKKFLYSNDPRIRVYDAIKFLDDDPDKLLDSCYKTYLYNIFLLENIAKDKPDWVVIDGLEIYSEIGEMVMRKRNGLKAFQGVANMNVWKDRKLLLKNLHIKAMNACKKGVIYTTYSTEEQVVRDGVIIESKKVPKYVGIVMYETDYVLRAEGEQTKDGKKFYLYVASSKNNNRLKDGSRFDITGKMMPLGEVEK